MIKKTLLMAMGMAALLGASVSTAFAGEEFDVDANLLGSNLQFTADEISGSWSTSLVQTFTATTVTTAGSGYLNFNQFKLDDNDLDFDITELSSRNSDTTYDLWLEYSYVASGPADGALQQVSFLEYTMYGYNRGTGTASPDRLVVTAATLSSAATTNRGSLDGELFTIAVGGIGGAENYAGEGALIGAPDSAFLVAAAAFILTAPDGESFFTGPRPFFNFALATESAQNPTFDLSAAEVAALFAGGATEVTREGFVGGTGEFSFAPIPEPATIALMGFGLLGLGLMISRRRVG